MLYHHISFCTLHTLKCFFFFNCLRHLLEPRILFSKDSPLWKAAFFHYCLIPSKMPEVELMAPYYMASSLPSLMTVASETGVFGEAIA